MSKALKRPNGLLAAGADLSIARLLDAYRQGIFPWFADQDPILWWSPDPRMVLVPDEIKISRSLGKTLRNTRYEVRFDTSFRSVMQACAEPREDRAGTWITAEMIDAYVDLHESGWAHSVETWIDGRLAGGLYGVAIGRMFYGESMFMHKRDASKIALVHLVRRLHRDGYGLVDCQMATDHLASLGAREISRAQFSRRVTELVNFATPSSWRDNEAET